MTDTTIFAAFAVGFISFISPCVLPLVPGYLSAVSGVAVGELGQPDRVELRRVVSGALLFSLTFTVMFVALGVTASSLGGLLQDHRTLLNKIAGSLIVAMGALFVSQLFIDRLNWQWHPQRLIERAGRGGPLIAGLAFAVAWTPCIGPTLAAILGTAATKDSIDQGALLLTSYSAGLALPFLISAVAFNYVLGSFKWLGRHYRILSAVAGLILIAVGILIYTNELFRLNIEVQKLLDSLGINFFRDL